MRQFVCGKVTQNGNSAGEQSNFGNKRQVTWQNVVRVGSSGGSQAAAS